MIRSRPTEVDAVVRRLHSKASNLAVAYEAGPSGDGLHGYLGAKGHACLVVAPSLLPKRPGAKVTTDRQDAEDLARRLRSGDLTAIWVPEVEDEAIRDVSRALSSHSSFVLDTPAWQRVHNWPEPKSVKSQGHGPGSVLALTRPPSRR